MSRAAARECKSRLRRVIYGIRNSYYRWKRRRAARKFEVYMRKQDRSQYFDEHGNFKDPNKDDKDSGGPRSPWVN